MERDRKPRLVRWLLLGAGILILVRAVQVQLVEHDYWEEQARLMQSRREPIPARRGEILASDGSVLAQSVANWSLAVDAKLIQNAPALATALDSLGLVSAPELLSKVAAHQRSRFIWLNRNILTETVVDPLLRRFPELVVRTEDKRLYPMGRAGGSVLGLMGRDQTPLGGLESLYDDKLRGKDGSELRVSDATDARFQGFEVTRVADPVSGCTITTTLHPRMQEIALGRMEAGVEREGARRGFCIITRPQTGEILALVQVPCADPEIPETWEGENLKVCPVTDAFEPGSSFKMLTFAGVIEDGLFREDEPVNCMGGSRPMPGGRPITDHERYGVLKGWEVLAHSSNIGTGLLAERLGPERFHRIERAFGFGLPTGIPLPGEGRGRISDPSTWSARSLATMAFGQEVSCTALQMAMAYGAVANGGNLMKPLLVRSVRGPDGEIIEEHEPEIVRPVIRSSTAAELRSLLRRVVTEGTGQKAEVEGFRPAGKTSTAQKYIPEEGSYSTRRYIGSFVGFAPYDDPQILCLVLMDEPTSSIYGGSVAAPIFREIVSDVMPFLTGEHAAPAESPQRTWAERQTNQQIDPQRVIPSVNGLSASSARRVLQDAGFRPRVVGAGTSVVECRPPAGERCRPETVVTLVLASPADSLGRALAMMPDLRGLTLRDALWRLRSVGVEPRISGSGWVLTQVPEPGEGISPGQSCLISLGPDSSRAYTEFLDGERRTTWAAAHGGLLAESPR